MTLALIPHLVAALLLSVALVFALRAPARRLDLVDYPGGRKTHAAPTPLVGGVAIFAAFLVATLSAGVALQAYLPLYASMLLLLICGVLDDLLDLRSTTKFAAQVVAAMVVVAWGNMVLVELADLNGLGPLSLGAWAVPLTLFGVVGLVNAVNMLDGVDGLAGGASLAMLFWLGVAAGLNGLPESQVVIAILTAALLGFLVFNARHPLLARASVFLGDAGSMVLGLAIAWFSLEVARAGIDGPVSPIAVGWIVALPVMDTVSLMLRRLLKRQSPFSADREHLHHLFMRAGYSPAQASWMLVAVAFGIGGVGLILSVHGVPDVVLALGLVVAIALHFVFIRYAWRTIRALRRLGARRAERGEADGLDRAREHCLTAPVRDARRGVALAGLYIMVIAIPLSSTFVNIGLGLILLATVASLRPFLRDMVRLPVFWLAVVLTAYVAAMGWVGSLHTPVSADQAQAHWRNILRATVLLSIPAAWWLAGARFHWNWLFWILIGSAMIAFLTQAHWPQLMSGALGEPDHFGSPDKYGSVAACVLVLLFTIAVGAISRLGRGWRPVFGLMICVAAGIPVLLLLVVSNYTTAWLGAAVGILIVGVSAAVYGANRRQWLALAGGALLVVGLGMTTWLLINEDGSVRRALQQPMQAAALYLGGERELARELHPEMAERLWLWSEALARIGQHPLTGSGISSPLAATTPGGVSDPDSFESFYLSFLVGYGVIGFGLFVLTVVVLVFRLARATQRRLLPAGLAIGLYGVLGTMGTMFLLSDQVDLTPSRTIVILLFAFLGAVAVMREWERDRIRRRRAQRHQPA